MEFPVLRERELQGFYFKQMLEDNNLHAFQCRDECRDIRNNKKEQFSYVFDKKRVCIYIFKKGSVQIIIQ